MSCFKLTFSALIGTLIFSAAALAKGSPTAESDTTKTIDEIILDRITVVGAPVWINSIPGAASYISPADLQRQNYTDINRILRTVSGINIQEEDGFGLRPNIGMRGAGVERSTKINLMEDGILAAPAPYSAPAAYYFPNMGRINSVEVRKGSAQIKYGPNTTGGAINLISTPIPSSFAGMAELSIGENNSNKVYTNLGNQHKNFGYMVEALHMGNDGFKQLDNNGSTGFTINDFLGKFMVRTNPDAPIFQRLELKAGYNDQYSDETYLGLTRDDFARTPLRRYAGSQADRMDTEHIQLMARHFALFSDHVDLTTTLYRNTFSREWYKLQSVNNTGLANVLNHPEQHQSALAVLRGSDSDDNALVVRSNNRTYYSQGVESILAISFDTGEIRNQVEFGVRFHQDEEDRFQFEDGYRMQNGEMVLTSAGVPGTQANRIGSATALSIYLKDQITYNRLTFSPGIRFENIWFTNRNYGTSDVERTGVNLIETEYTISEFVPGAGVTFKVSDNFTLISGVHRGFSPPSPGSASDTRSEQSINYELGFRFADNLVRSELIGFYNNYSNLLGSDLAAGGGGGTTAQFNAGKVRVYGVEFSTNTDFSDLFDFSSVTFPFNLNYTFTNATFRSDFVSDFGPWGSVVAGDEIPYIPRHQLNAALGFGKGAYSLNLNTVFSPHIRTVAGSGSPNLNERTDRYFLLDLSSNYQATSSVNLFVNVRNLLDQTYIVSDRPAGVRPGLPRTFMGGMRFTL